MEVRHIPDIINVDNSNAGLTTATFDNAHYDTITGFVAGATLHDTMRLTLDSDVLQAFNAVYSAQFATNISVANDKIVVLTSGVLTMGDSTPVHQGRHLRRMGNGQWSQAARRLRVRGPR